MDDIASTYVQYMHHLQNKEKKKFTLYIDSYSAQNTNYM